MSQWKPGEYCDRCDNDGVVNCYCGGDLCVCENYGEMDCPRCHGMSAEYYNPDEYERDELEEAANPPATEAKGE